jgi:DNA polymerase III alpha subunit
MLQGYPRHLGIHNGGFVISGPPLIEQIPVEPASMEDRFVVQWDKDALEMTGWIKLDVLSLRMLSAIAEAFRLAKRPRELPLRSVDEQVSLLPMDQATRLSTAFAMTGTSLEAHLTELRRDVFTKAGATSISELPHLKHGQHVKIGGLIVARQHPPTAKGFAFLTVEDPGGMVNVVIAPDIYARDRAALQGGVRVG